MFKVGDRVVGMGKWMSKDIDGKTGAVKSMNGFGAVVHFDENVGGWGRKHLGIPHGYGWGVPFEQLRHIDEIKVGDRVKVINTDGCFRTYTDFFVENDLTQFLPMYKYGNPIEKGTYKVVAIGKHRNRWNGPIYVLKSGNQVWLMHERHYLTSNIFLEKVQKSKNTIENIKIIRNGPATIVILEDGTKGVAKCHSDDAYCAAYGLGIAYERAKGKAGEEG